MARDEYEGRMECDGNGNLLASEVRNVGTHVVPVFDEDGNPVEDANGEQLTVTVPILRYGKNHGRPIAHDKDNDKFMFIDAKDKSHNERHSKQALEVVATQTVDPDLPGYAGTKAKPTKGYEHHFGVLEDDDHYDADAPNNTRLRQLPDKVAARASSHTHQHKRGDT